MKKNKLILSVASTIALGVVTYFILRKKNLEKRLVRVAEEGYETAYDILYPLKTRKVNP